jgi:hypothetical protein
MVDKLKRSLEHLDPPDCPKCNVEMKWLRSSLVDEATIVHVFVCPGCSTTAETKSTIGATRGALPKKLSASRHRPAA